MLLPWNPKRSSVLTSLIVPFGHEPGGLATRKSRWAERTKKLGDVQLKHRVQKRSFAFMLLRQCSAASSSQRGSGLS